MANTVRRPSLFEIVSGCCAAFQAVFHGVLVIRGYRASPLTPGYSCVAFQAVKRGLRLSMDFQGINYAFTGMA